LGGSKKDMVVNHDRKHAVKLHITFLADFVPVWKKKNININAIQNTSSTL
jgi:hypothetical protein